MKLIDYWKDKFIGKNENSPAFRRRLASQLDKKQLKYVSERIGDDDFVIGHAGYITLNSDHDELLVTSNDSGTLFRAKIDTLKMNEFLSLDGIIFTGEDIEHDNRERCVIAYYTYYRKVEN